MSLEDRMEIQDLVHKYAYHVDLFEIAEWIALFAPDGILDESEFGMGRHEGRDGLRAYGEGIKGRVQHLVHLMANHLIWEIDEHQARGTCFAIVESMQKTGARARYQVMYEDQYRRLDGRWMIQQRMLRKTFPPEILAS